jgi:hypothetical protein
MRSLLLAMIAAPLVAAPTYPVTLVYDGMPPPRFRESATVTVKTGAVAECGDAAPGLTFEACVRDKTVFIPNPCDFPAEKLAVLLCHEIAHAANHWPAEHGP